MQCKNAVHGAIKDKALNLIILGNWTIFIGWLLMIFLQCY